LASLARGGKKRKEGKNSSSLLSVRHKWWGNHRPCIDSAARGRKGKPSSFHLFSLPTEGERVRCARYGAEAKGRRKGRRVIAVFAGKGQKGLRLSRKPKGGKRSRILFLGSRFFLERGGFLP